MSREPHLTPSTLDDYLRHALPVDQDHWVRAHLEECRTCWQQWNRHLWDAALHNPLRAGLAEFLGSGFQPYLDPRIALAAEWEAARISSEQDAARFFRTSIAYLYDLVVTEASGYRQDNVARVLPTLARHGVQSVLDYGCGIGSDTIALHTSGFAVVGCDFTSPATAFLRWRCPEIPVVEPDQLCDVPVPDVLWITDMLDYLPDVETSLGDLLSSVELLVIRNLALRAVPDRHHFGYRHPADQVAAVLTRHGLAPAWASDSSPVMVWERRHRRR